MIHGFASFLSHPSLDRVVVPMIQRDYAQGRPDADTRRIRVALVSALARSATGGAPTTLDFVFGPLDRRSFVPLDGQQRLTTLFLLFVYLAARAQVPAEDRGFLEKFTYEVRKSVRQFCEELAKLAALPPGDTLSAAITDEPWFAPGWERDPTVAGMLVVLDEIHRQLGEADPRECWDRLVAPGSCAITFHHLSLCHAGSAEQLYVRMNARGKRLSEFENFKADLFGHVERRRPGAAQELGDKLDGDWAHAFWPYRGEDNVIDEQIERYLQYVVDVQARLDGVLRLRPDHEQAIDWAVRVLCDPPERSTVAVLARHLDPWSLPADPSREFFQRHFAVGAHVPGKLTLFRPGTANLLEACTGHYRPHPPAGENYLPNPGFSLLDELLLHAAGVHRLEQTDDFAGKVRVLRNLGEATSLRAEQMPAALAATTRLVRVGIDDGEGPWLARQVDEERRKAGVRAAQPALVPALHRLEDHPLLRGTVAAFPLDSRLPPLVDAFYEAFPLSADPRRPSADPALHLALLATLDYAWAPRWRGRRLVDGGVESWRAYLGREGMPADGDAALTRLLDRLATGETAGGIVAAFLAGREAEGALDWRYYLLKYPGMRGHGPWRLQFVDELGFDLHLRPHTTPGAQREDAYLSALRACLADLEPELSPWGYWDWQLDSRALPHAPFPERWLTHLPSGQHVRFTPGAVVLRRCPGGAGEVAPADTEIPLPRSADLRLDTEDRVALAAAAFRARITGVTGG